MNRTTRTATAALVAAALSATLSASASAGTLPPRCRTPHLGVTLGRTVAIHGNRDRAITITNDGRSSCTATGYPQLGLAARDGGREHAVTTDGDSYITPDPGPSATIQAPGWSATAHLGWYDDGNPGRYAAASYLLVRVQGAAWSVWAPLRKSYSPVLFRLGRLTVTGWTVKKGSN